jgi:hypothetical protein
MMNGSASCAVLCGLACIATLEPVGYLICVTECATFFCTDPPGDTEEPVVSFLAASGAEHVETAEECPCAQVPVKAHATGAAPPPPKRP